MKIPSWTKLLMIPALLYFTGCDEQDVQYETAAQEEIPEVPGEPASIAGRQGPMAGVPSMADSAGFSLPSPEIQDFPTDKPEGDFVIVSLVGLTFPVPAEYEAVETNSPMRAAQWTVPREGEEGVDAELVAYYFGPGQGGGVEDNAMRWFRQFDPRMEGGNPLGLYQQDKHDGLTITRIFLEGTWTPPRMPGMGATPDAQQDWAMDSLIIEGGPEGTLFLRMTGPRRLVRVQDPAMEYLAGTVNRAEGEDEQ